MSSNPRADTAEFTLPPPATGAPPPALSAKVHVDLAALSHQGKVRTNNEDSYLVGRFERTLRTLLTNLPDGIVPDCSEEIGYGMVVADGMGGRAAGEIASRMAISTLINLALEMPDWIMRIGDSEGDKFLRRITRLYLQVNAVLGDEMRKNPDLAGMGTTMSLVCTIGSDLFLGHIGDSRIYLRRGGELRQLTRDHTYAQTLADMGMIRPEEVGGHQMRRVLIQVLGGGGGEMIPDVQRLSLEPNDELLLCSDGLTDLVDDSRIAGVLQQAENAQLACQGLIDAALQSGGTDNVTAVVARYSFGQN